MKKYFEGDKYCPICYKTYEQFPEVCECGYSAFKKEHLDYDAQLFQIFKYAKQIFVGLLPYKTSKLLLNECEDYIYIDEIIGDKRGIEYIDLVGKTKPTCAYDGLLAMSVSALILNCDYASSNFLDESCLKILFLGKDFKGFLLDDFIQPCYLKYIYVDKRNPYFEVRDNVLINKKSQTIIAYPRDKKGEEYKVDNDIQYISQNAFRHLNHLKKIYIPNKLILNKNFSKDCKLEIVRY